MVLRQSSKSTNLPNTGDLKQTNQDIAIELVKGFLGSGSTPIMETKNSETQTIPTLMARANLDAYYIATLFNQTVFWLNQISLENKK